MDRILREHLQCALWDITTSLIRILLAAIGLSLEGYYYLKNKLSKEKEVELIYLNMRLRSESPRVYERDSRVQASLVNVFPRKNIIKRIEDQRLFLKELIIEDILCF